MCLNLMVAPPAERPARSMYDSMKMHSPGHSSAASATASSSGAEVTFGRSTGRTHGKERNDPHRRQAPGAAGIRGRVADSGGRSSRPQRGPSLVGETPWETSSGRTVWPGQRSPVLVKRFRLCLAEDVV